MRHNLPVRFAPSLFFRVLSGLLSVAIASQVIAAPWELWTIKADGGGLTALANAPGETYGSPDWSPDGKFVAYDTWHVGQPLTASQIGVCRADGSQPRLLGAGAMPSWSPDGKQIVCHTYDSPQTIAVIDADGRGGRETIAEHWGSPRWSPRGNRIASVLSGNIALYDLASGKEQRILSGRYYVRQGFSISPDGLKFCFGTHSGGVAVATLDEQTMRARTRVLVKQGACHHTSWSPDGTRVVFAWQPTDSHLSQIYILKVDGDEAPIPIEGQNKSRNNYNPDWSPDGRTIVFASELNE